MTAVAATRPGRWRRMTVALLAGTATMGTLAFFGTLFQTPGLEGPVQIAPIAVVSTVLAVTALPLVWWGDGLGYVGAALAGGAAVVGIALYLAGVFGPTRTAPAAYLFLGLGALLVVTALVAWRERAAPGPGTSPS